METRSDRPGFFYIFKAGMERAKNNIRIVFMGTPEFAVPSLASLIDNGYDVCAVVTAPDRPAGRRGGRFFTGDCLSWRYTGYTLQLEIKMKPDPSAGNLSSPGLPPA